jgi:hypothetical protein
LRINSISTQLFEQSITVLVVANDTMVCRITAQTGGCDKCRSYIPPTLHFDHIHLGLLIFSWIPVH